MNTHTRRDICRKLSHRKAFWLHTFKSFKDFTFLKHLEYHLILYDGLVLDQWWEGAIQLNHLRQAQQIGCLHSVPSFGHFSSKLPVSISSSVLSYSSAQLSLELLRGDRTTHLLGTACSVVPSPWKVVIHHKFYQ